MQQQAAASRAAQFILGISSKMSLVLTQAGEGGGGTIHLLIGG